MYARMCVYAYVRMCLNNETIICGQHASCPIRILYLCQIIAYCTHILVTTLVFVRACIWCVWLRAYMYVYECAHLCLNNQTINKLPMYKLPYSNAIYNSTRSYGLRKSTAHSVHFNNQSIHTNIFLHLYNRAERRIERPLSSRYHY